MAMKTAEQWADDLGNEVDSLDEMTDEQVKQHAVLRLRAIQADALEAAAERLREEANLLLAQGGPTQAAMVTSMSMKYAANV